MNNEPIDFVICWVDGNDPEWQEEKKNYKPGTRTDNRNIRYRDWENLQYWFRGVEKFAPWVNKIHFVTWGHIPSWLDTKHPKINIVRHEDYIPNEYLPTFSARPIEVNLHRIEGLAEQFVYFNDDMFILQPLKKEDFFNKGLPCDTAALDIAVKEDEAHATSVFNSIRIINDHFDKKKSFKCNFLKWFNIKYKGLMIRTFLLMPWKLFTGFHTPHLPNSYLKETFYEVWKQESEILNLTSNNKFRNRMDVTQYLFKFWQLASGNFFPRKKMGRLYRITHNIKEIQHVIEIQKYKVICLNDTEDVVDFDGSKSLIIDSFNKVFKEKSNFEV
ncbi:MAG TPA: stealth family protein [Pseudogracilibacillus sp.]|nr:stealth family protein [Pseudogracilibacillus sp.]